METETKFCRDCEFLLGNRHNPSLTEWKCWHPSNIASSSFHPVTGIKETLLITPDIELVRTMGCKGEWFKEYIKPTYTPPTAPSMPAEKLASLRKRLSNITVDEL